MESKQSSTRPNKELLDLHVWETDSLSLTFIVVNLLRKLVGSFELAVPHIKIGLTHIKTRLYLARCGWKG